MIPAHTLQTHKKRREEKKGEISILRLEKQKERIIDKIGEKKKQHHNLNDHALGGAYLLYKEIQKT